VNGNLGASKAHYFEGDSVPYRLRLTGLSTGVGNPHTVVIQWDTLQGGKHAIDYITSYDRTVTDADPCAGPANQFPNKIADCGPFTTFPIPADSLAAPGTQISGVLTLFGGTISDAVYSGPTGTDAARSLTITFTADVSNPVLAWGGHIATRQDWGLTGSAVSIPGSPYHMRFLGLDGQGGNQDRSLSAQAIIFPVQIKIIKSVDGFISVDGVSTEFTTSTDDFQFFLTDPNTTAFTLKDEVVGTAPSAADSNNQSTGGDWEIFSYTTFPVSGTVSEPGTSSSGLSLLNIDCSLTHGLSNTGSYTTAGTQVNFSNLDEGDNLTCTFVNSRGQVTAATAVVTGRVTTAAGKGIKGATVTASNFNGVQTVSVKTDAKGNYTFTKLETNDGYNFSASAKGYTLTASGQSTFFPLGDSKVVNFTGTAAAPTKGGKNQ
jgi:hypothetical protein